MIKIKKEITPTGLSVKLTGSIEETVDFVALIGPPPASMEVNCKGITRINSAGVRAWITYFQACKARGTKLRFVECSMCIVEQINLISNFPCGGQIVSIYVPFFCRRCRKSIMELHQMVDLQKQKFVLSNITCKDCGNPAEFDGQPDEYFENLQRQG